MRLLRLTNSDDLQDYVSTQQNAAAIEEQRFVERFGEPLEWVARLAWPTPRMAEMAMRFVDEVQPDMVFIRINGFWVSHESVPLKLRRRFGRAGEGVATAAAAAGRNRWLSEQPAFQVARRSAVRLIGGVPLFTTPEILPRIEAMLRDLTRSESFLVVVRGPYGDRVPGGNARDERRSHARARELDRGVAEICSRLRIPYRSIAQEAASGGRPATGKDRLHTDAHGQAQLADWEFPLIAEAWEKARS
ncbi:MAG: hypothetical protein ACKVVT_19830 [Dehalococcoidia bacterium]